LADQTANWKRDQAMSLVESWILAYPNLNGILAENDDMAMGAVQAIQSANKGDQIKVSGIDAIPDALQAVKAGTELNSVFQDAKSQGTKSVDVALAWAQGQKQDKSVIIPFQLVTKDNVDKYIGLNAQ
jgi:ABC-type sugar transport system, periplasmic component